LHGDFDNEPGGGVLFFEIDDGVQNIFTVVEIFDVFDQAMVEF
jgi:hypothetical protein